MNPIPFPQSGMRFLVCVTVMFRNLEGGLCADGVSVAARRRRDRRLRAFVKHVTRSRNQT